MATTAIATLTTAFEETFITPGQVVLSWPSVPIEIVRAAGLLPVIARGAARATPAADAHLEAEIFPSRLRHLVNAALTGRLSHAVRLILPRTSDHDYKCFLYLREFMRLEVAKGIPPTLLFNLLQSRGPEVREYNAARTRELFDELAKVSGHRPSVDDLRHEIEKTNMARAAVRRLTALRRGAPRVRGAEVFPLLAAFWFLAPANYASLANEAAHEIANRRPLAGPRVLLAGAPVDSAALHVEIESRGAIVVSEIGPWGSGAAGDDVVSDGDPITALSEKYSTDAIGPRTPVLAMRNAFVRGLDEADAVVFSLPPEDTTFGWDYPALRRVLETRRIPYACLRGDPYQPLSESDAARLDELVRLAATETGARHV
jgi:benzoyl-CoA reductase/2-hydroxyglutaryl-CoA dehydratase subunit BcrC/BadD/HgdB